MSAAGVTDAPATCYAVRNGWAWANLYVRHGLGETGAGDPRGWVELVVNSDYGSFGFCWSHIGAEPWQEFLAGLDFHYAMQKLLGERFKVPLSSNDAADKARRLVLDQRRQRALTKADALCLWDAIEWSDSSGTASDFLREWDSHSDGAMYRNEMYDATWDQPNPQAVGFWDQIWPHFIAALVQQHQAAP